MIGDAFRHRDRRREGVVRPVMTGVGVRPPDGDEHILESLLSLIAAMSKIPQRSATPRNCPGSTKSARPSSSAKPGLVIRAATLSAD